MENSDLLKALGSLTEEQRAALAQILVPTKKEEKKKTYETARAQKTYFFKQLNVREVISETKRDDRIIQEIRELPPRIIAVDDKMAWRLYHKGKGKYQFLGASDGTAWRDARNSGKTIAEAQAIEYQAMLTNPDTTPPVSREKTFFSGKTMAQVSRGQEIPWSEGVRQTKNI